MSFFHPSRFPRLCLAAVLLACLAPAARAATDTVTTLSGSVSTSGSLPYEIANAAAGDTLVFQAGLTGTITLASTLTINENLTLQGPGANLITVSGNHSFQVFNISSGTVSISGLTIADGKSIGGGGITNSGTLTVTGVAFSGNSGNNVAGGIENVGALTVINSTFSGNSTTGSGGGIFDDNGAIALTVINSTFSRNSAGSFGGGIGVYNGTATVINSTFSGNSAAGGGSGIGNGGNLTVNNSVFSDNSSGANAGGGILGLNATTHASFNVFFHNLADGSEDDCDSCTTNTHATTADPKLAPLGNYGGSTQTMLPQPGSGAICAASDALVGGAITDQRGFPLNASCVDAGAVQTNYLVVTTTVDPGSSLCISGVCSLRAAITTANSAGYGDIDFGSGVTGTITLASALPAITGQVLLLGPGASSLTVSGGGSTAVGSIFTVNSGAGLSLDGLTIADGNTTGNGGGVNNNGTLTVNNSTLSNNSVDNNNGTGGGIYSAGTLTVSDSTLSGNFATDAGGISIESGTATVTGSTFSANAGLLGGGGIDSAGTLSVSSSTFFGNTATHYGGGIASEGTLTVSNSIFSGNSITTTSMGAGIDIAGGTGNASYNVFFHNQSQFGEEDCTGCTTNSNETTTDPELAPLGSYGGPTPTMLPLPGSSAICAGLVADVPAGVTTDQRGFARLNSTYTGSNCVDAGAVQTNYTSVQFGSSSYSGVAGQAASPPPIVSVTENGQNIGSVPITLTDGSNTVTGLGPVSTVAGTGATFSNVEDSLAEDTTLSATLQITPAAITPAYTLSASASLVTTEPTIQVTVSASPAGAPFLVDSTQYTSAQTLTWIVGTPHELAALAAATGPGAEYFFTGWSDGGAIFHSVAPTVATSYTASYAALYDLTTSVNNAAYGTVSPATGNYFPTATPITLTATPNAGYYFTGWTGSTADIASPSSASTTISMTGPDTVTANFALIPSYVVTTTVDVDSSVCSVVCSLRAAIAAANLNSGGSGNITFAPDVTGTITLGSALPALSGVVNITGPGAGSLTVSGNNSTTVGSIFTVNSGATVTISGLTIANGNTTGNGGGINNSGTLTVNNSTLSNNSNHNSNANGGAIYSAGTLTVSDSTLSGNFATEGGGISIESNTATVTNSTFAGNSASTGGGGIENEGTLTVNTSTFFGNSASSSGVSTGGGIDNNGSLTVTNSIFSGNSANGSFQGGGAIYDLPDTTNASYDVFYNNRIGGGFESDCDGCASNTNETTADPMLAALGSYGGSTPTMLPLPGSSAICAGSTALIPSGVTTDQRGFARLNSTYTGSPCVDAGAVQTNYTAVQFSSVGYSGVIHQSVSPAPIVSLIESGQSVGGVPVTLGFSGTGAATGLGPVTTVAATGAAFSSLNVNATGSDTLSATLQITPAAITPAYSLAATASLSITLLPQAITFTPSSPVTYGVAPIALSARGGASGNAVTFSYVSGPCSLASTTLTITGAGNCVIAANQAGNASYAAAPQVTQTIMVNQAVLTVAVSGTPVRQFGQPNPVFAYTLGPFVNGDVQGTATTGAPALTTAAAPKSNAGNYTIAVAQNTLAAANYSFNLVNGQLIVTGGAAQAILFPPLASFTHGTSVPLVAVATSGLAVTFTVTGPANITGGNTLNITGTGPVTVTASVAATTNFAAATSVLRTFTAQ